MELNFVTADTQDFDAHTYLSMLMAIAKADKDNGSPEYDYVRRRADHLGLAYETFFENVDAHFLLERRKVSRLTALVILKDAILLAAMDGNFSLPERKKVYTYAETLNISRSDVDKLVDILADYQRLDRLWNQLRAGY